MLHILCPFNMFYFVCRGLRAHTVRPYGFVRSRLVTDIFVGRGFTPAVLSVADGGRTLCAPTGLCAATVYIQMAPFCKGDSLVSGGEGLDTCVCYNGT